MKNFIFLFTLLGHLLLYAQSSWSQEGSSSLLQEQLNAASVLQGRANTLIKISDKVSYSLESSPNIDNMKKALGLVIPENVRQRILDYGGIIPPEVNPLEGYDGLSQEKKEQFQKTRMIFLQNVARALSATRFVFGFGSIVGDSLSFVKDSVKGVTQRTNSLDASVPKEKVSFSERSRNAVEATLQALDYKLWNQAPLLLDSNEFGVSASLGIMIENGVLNNGMGGSEELGLSFAYNKANKAFIFEVFHNSEKYSYTPAVVTAAGVLIKAGPHFGQRDIERQTKILTGTSFYPPAMPGYSTTGTDYFSAGFSSSIGFPPNPIVDMLTYTNKFERNSIIRVTLSPVMKGYVRCYIGNVAGSMKLVLFRFAAVYNWISDQIAHRATGRLSCEKVLL